MKWENGESVAGGVCEIENSLRIMAPSGQYFQINVCRPGLRNAHLAYRPMSRHLLAFKTVQVLCSKSVNVSHHYRL